MVNFLSLFDRLYRKYAHLRDPQLIARTTRFYQEQIMQVIRHIKTSFDRIYQYSKLPKSEVLLSFQRIVSELRSGMQEFLKGKPEVEEQLQEE